MYRVTFKFIEAKGLKAGDYWVKVHPKAGKKLAKQTRKIKDTTAPKWDEEIELVLSPLDEVVAELMKSDKAIGRIPLGSVGLLTDKHEEWFKIEITGSTTSSDPPPEIRVWVGFQRDAKTQPKHKGLRAAMGAPGGHAQVASKRPAKEDTDTEECDTGDSNLPPKRTEGTDATSKASRKDRKSNGDSLTAAPSKLTSNPSSTSGTPKTKSRLKVSLESIGIVMDGNQMTKGLKAASNSGASVLLAQNDIDAFISQCKNAPPTGALIGLQSTCSVAGIYSGVEDLTVRVGLDVARINEELLQSCGIDSNMYVVVQMKFKSGSYLSGDPPHPALKTLQIRQCPKSVEVMNRKEIAGMSEFGLMWTLEQRLWEYLETRFSKFEVNAREVVNKIAKALDKTGPETLNLLEAFDMPISQLSVVQAALKKANGDEQLATNFLFDEEERMKLEKISAPKKAILSESTGFLETVGGLVLERIQTTTKFCPVCDAPHPLELLKPIVCEKELCGFQFSSLGVGCNVESEILHNPEVVDLLVSVTMAAAFQGNRFEPFPKQVLMINKEKKEVKISNTLEVVSMLTHLPDVDALAELVRKGTLRKTLEALHPLLYLLLRWILASNRVHIRYLASGPEKIPNADDVVQFIMKSSSPEKELQFHKHKKEKGSFWAFHGSSFGNWHSILRNGLKNYSNTVNQTNGAAYGPGIYLAGDAQTSYGYASYSGTGWAKSKWSSNLKLVAVCEVIDDGTAAACNGTVHRPNCHHCSGSPYYRVEAEDMIVTRYLLVFPPSVSYTSLNTSTINVPKSLHKSFKGTVGNVVNGKKKKKKN